MSLRGKGAIADIGETTYSNRSEQTSFELQIEASLKAIADAGLSPRAIDGIIPLGITSAPAEDFVSNFGTDAGFQHKRKGVLGDAPHRRRPT